MKLVMLIPNLEYGGAQKIAVGLAEQAVKNSISVSFITLYGSNNYIKRLNNIGVDVVNLNYSKGFGLLSIQHLVKLRRKLFNTLNSLKPDVIHTHLFLIKYMLITFKNVNKIPIVDTQHDNSPWWGAISIKDKFMTFIEKRFFNKIATKVVAISASVEQDLLNIIKLDNSKVCKILNFIDIIDPEEKILPKLIDSKEIKIYVISRLDLQKKGLDQVLLIFTKLIEKNKNYRLFFVGDGPDRAALEKEVASKKISKYVKFEGFKSNVKPYYKDASIILMPSRWEGFGLVAAEAAYMGVPVVGSKVGGLQEVIINNETGFTIDFNDVENFVSSIEFLRLNKESYMQFSKNSHLHACLNYDIRFSFEKYMNLYKSLVANNA